MTAHSPALAKPVAQTMIPVSRPAIGKEELAAVQRVFESRWLGMGSTVSEFEGAVSDFLGGAPRSYVTAVDTGTSALHLALDVAGVGLGDEVIVPSLTFAATIQAITALSAVPVFCDVSPDTLTINCDDVERCITPKTRAIIPVHYRGVPCPMQRILGLARENRWRVIEDAAHAFGSSYGNERVGSFGDLTCFSFDPIKNVTCGEGGAVVTRDSDTRAQLRRKRCLGIDADGWSRQNSRDRQYDIGEQGYRYHMSNINAAIGLEQLKKFSAMNARKIAIARHYDASFKSLPGIRLLATPYEGLALFMYVVRILSRKREDLMAFLRERWVDSGIHYVPAHHFSYFQRFVQRELPMTDEVGPQILMLPLYAEMSDEDVDRVIESVQQWSDGV